MDRTQEQHSPLESTFGADAVPPAVLALLAVAATTLSLAAWDSDGTISSLAIRWLCATVAAGGLAVLALWSRSFANSRSALLPVLLGCIGVQFAASFWSPISYPVDRLGVGGLRTVYFLIGFAAVVAGSLCAPRPAFGKWTFPILVVVQASLGVILILRLQIPGIDVLMFQTQSCDALRHGYDPYNIRFPDPYLPMQSAMYYGPGVSVNGVLQFGYPYMPITLLMALPGFVMGDVRLAGLACVVMASALIAYSRRTPEAKAAAVLLMFSPIAPLVSVLAWTESYVILLLALTWFCYCRKPKLLPYAFGLLVVSKQYMLGMAPLGLLLLPRPWTLRGILGFAAKAALAGMVVTAPLVLWNPKAFWDSAITLQARQPYRPDALSFLVWFSPSDPAKWVWLPFAGIASMLVVCLATATRRAITFPMALALCLLAFFALNKQAFANYYYLVIGAFCVAAGGDVSEPPAAADDSGSVAAGPEHKT